MTAYQIECNKKDNQTEYLCSGDLTIRHIKNILSDFIINSCKSSEMRIELKNVEFIDLTFLQILISFIDNYCQNSSNAFIFNYELEDEHLELLKNTGFIDIIETYQTHNHVNE